MEIPLTTIARNSIRQQAQTALGIGSVGDMGVTKAYRTSRRFIDEKTFPDLDSQGPRAMAVNFGALHRIPILRRHNMEHVIYWLEWAYHGTGILILVCKFIEPR